MYKLEYYISTKGSIVQRGAITIRKLRSVVYTIIIITITIATY